MEVLMLLYVKRACDELWPEQSSVLCERLGVHHPIIQAPMAGGPSTPQLVSAVKKVGGLGSIAAGYLSGEKLSELIGKAEFF